MWYSESLQPSNESDFPGDLFDMLLPLLVVYQDFVRNHATSLEVITLLEQLTSLQVITLLEQLTSFEVIRAINSQWQDYENEWSS